MATLIAGKLAWRAKLFAQTTMWKEYLVTSEQCGDVCESACTPAAALIFREKKKMENEELKTLQSCIADLQRDIDALMKSEIVKRNKDLKILVGGISSQLATFLEFDFLPTLTKMYPGFEEI